MGAALARTVIGQARPAGVVPRYLVNTLVSFTDKAAGFRSLCVSAGLNPQLFADVGAPVCRCPD
jgi:hypothetical protein